ncbi:hypothetical protein HPB47_020908 [Ixodes persulcatus]|uniref:Uncharacterized protein n=1 Tax=Ixodes persulcatus TaxID=34615 RepID=A0AC60QG58_IXOPE|nr:hypothetical protein HPB47_020908 [Ixodes persulcatus]
MTRVSRVKGGGGEKERVRMRRRGIPSPHYPPLLLLKSCALNRCYRGTYAEAAARGAAPPLKASVGTQYSSRDFECSTSPPTPSEAPVGSQTPAAPPKLPHTKTMLHRLGPKPRVVLDATPPQSSEVPTPSTSQREEEAMEVSVDPTEPPPPAKGGTKSAHEKGDQKKKPPRVTAPTNAS